MPKAAKLDEEKKSQLLELIKDRYDQAAAAQEKVISGMEISRLFYRGDQWLLPANKSWQKAPEKKWKVRLTINKMPAAVEGNVSVFMRSKPIIVASARTDDEKDRNNALVSEKLLRSHFYDGDMEEEEIDMLTWKFTTGNGFLYTYWDPTGGTQVPQYETTEPEIDPLTGAIVKEGVQKLVGWQAQGETKTVSIDPFSIAIEPGATKLKDAAWVMITEFWRTSQIEEKFDIEVEAEQPSEGSTSRSMKEVRSMYSPEFLENTGRSTNSKDRKPVTTMFERPTPQNPLGRIVYATDDDILHEDVLPGGEIRLEHFKNIRLPGELWATSGVNQSIPLQMELNRIRSQIVENRNLTSRPKLLCIRGSVELDEVTSEPGEIVEFDQLGTFKPEWLTPPSIPAYVVQELSWVTQDIDDIMSRHEASQGRLSTQITSGAHAERFREADTSRYLPAMLLFERGLERVGKNILKTDIENMNGPQIRNIIGDNLDDEIAKFDMKDVSTTCRVRFHIASQWPWDREAMRQVLYQLHSVGGIDTQELMDRLEVPTSDRIYQQDRLNKSNAEAENRWLLAGEKFDPLPTDNHRVHLRYHTKALNTPEMRKFYLKNREVLNPLMEHMAKHHEALPKPDLPPMAPKLNLPAKELMMTEEGRAMILQVFAQQLGIEPTPENPAPDAPSGARAPGMQQQQQPKGMASPPGGMSGEMYGPGPSGMGGGGPLEQ